ncbi:MAG: hypothetical protein MJ194_03055 [Clostridia bacterium]|nr:hypothetical protein [Clostridia bacterium]
MTERQKLLMNNAADVTDLVLEAEKWLWQHPQTGYTEWEANEYLIGKFEALGYTLVRADKDEKFGKIPGFYTDFDTGRPGPTIAVFGELDALDIANHPESVNGMTHCCGHNAQGAYLLGLAAALKVPGTLDGLCGKIRLIAVPAEEMIQLPFREELRKKGVIRYLGGKVEFMYRGYLNGVDMALMVHAYSEDLQHPSDFNCSGGMNGCVAKTFRYKGKSAHAGGSPEAGLNAQYAAMIGLDACNALRETFPDEDHVRFHPIMHGVNCAVNIIPDELKLESYVRASTLEAIKRENRKVNRAIAAGALAMGCGVELCDRPGYAPEYHDPMFMKLAQDCCEAISGRDMVDFDYRRIETGSSDFGDITCVMPGIQMNAAGCSGTLHGIDFCVAEPGRLCMNSIKFLLFITDELLRDNAKKAADICAQFKYQFKSIPEYLKYIDEITLDKDAVVYGENGSAVLDYV